MPKIYKIVNDINDKIYVGKTEFSLQKRFAEHCREAFRAKNQNRPLYRAMREYGIKHFSIELIEETDYPEEREIYWIRFCDSFKNGYNATMGGESPRRIDYEEVLQTYASVKNAAEVARVLHMDRGYVSDILAANNIKAVPSGEVTRARYGTPVVMLSMDGKPLRNFESTRCAARYLLESNQAQSGERGVAHHISEVCKGERGSAYGYLWKHKCEFDVPLDTSRAVSA